MIAIILLTAGLFALAAAQRQHCQLLAPFAARTRPEAVAATGWICLAGSLTVQLAGPSRLIALLTWIGLVALIAGLIVLGRAFVPRWTAAALFALAAVWIATFGMS